jgi:Fic family protein
LLYLSLHFKRHRDEYYRLLQEVRLTGCWEDWLRFFFEGVIQTSESATATARGLLDLFARHRKGLAGESATVLRLHERLQHHPVISVPAAAKALAVTHPTATKAVRTLEKHGIVREMTGGDYRRLYIYHDYLAILGEEKAP